MSLYVRIETSFYSHRKTLRLRGIIGDDAFWVPPRLWSYAAANQPDGDFADYAAQEIADLIDYRKDAKAMLEAMLAVRFLDAAPLRIHDWHEYNGILDFFSKRAKKAADARWKKAKGAKQLESEQIKADQSKADQSRSEASIASSNASSIMELPISCSTSPYDLVVKAWNEGPFPKPKAISAPRKKSLSARLRDPFFRDNWRAALTKLVESPFCNGQNDRGWVANFDWFLRPDSVLKIIEGKYDNGKPKFTPTCARP